MSAECDKLLLVQAEFDGELAAADALAALQHRETCAECQAAYDALVATRALMREEAPRFAAPERLRAAIRGQLAAQAPNVSSSGRRWAMPSWARPGWRDGASFALGAGLAAAIAALMIVPSQSSLLDSVVADHIRALQPGHLEDVVSTDEHTVKPWFDGRIDFAPPVKDLAAERFPLLGGRLDYLDGRPVAALVYGRDKHLIDLYVWPESGAEIAPRLESRNGYNVVHWREHGMTFWAVSDLEAAQLEEFGRLWRAG